MTVDRESPVPLYRQLYDLLRSRIMQGDLTAGEVIPTEMDLVQHFNLSRVTVRRALQLLVDEGLVLRQAGKGSFVYSHRLQENVSLLRGFAETMLDQYPNHIMEILGFEIVPVPGDIGHYLALEPDARVVCIKRRHMLKEVPLAFAVIYLPLDIGGLLTPHGVSVASIYSLIAQKTTVVIRSATQTISAIAADQELASLLYVPVAAPVLLVKRITYSNTSRPVEYIQLYYPGGKHELAMEVYRDSMRVSADEDPLQSALTIHA